MTTPSSSGAGVFPPPLGETPAIGLMLRRIMRQWATGVTILTVTSGDEQRGMTCNSFTSVSDNPASVLVCVRISTRTHDLIVESGRFTINFLPATHQDYADRFSGVHGEVHDRFDDIPHTAGPAGAPWLVGALGYLDCRLIERHDGGTHTIFVAEVEVAEPGAEEAAPLLRFRSRYTKLVSPM